LGVEEDCIGSQGPHSSAWGGEGEEEQEEEMSL
jgi:hypothetical protein